MIIAVIAVSFNVSMYEEQYQCGIFYCGVCKAPC